MPYTDKFQPTDDLLTHLNSVVPTIKDSFILSRYTGFVSISAVTVYELAIKEIFIDFAKRKHKIFGNFTEISLGRINGRIKISDLKKEFITKFGDKYVKKFEKALTNNQSLLNNQNLDIQVSYNNLLNCRHSFVHKNIVTMTYSEVIIAYNFGKEVIKSLAEAMSR